MQTYHSRAAAVDAAHNDTPDDDALIGQPALRRMLGNVSDMTIWRWRKVGIIPEPISIRQRNYWRAGDVRALLARLAERAA